MWAQLAEECSRANRQSRKWQHNKKRKRPRCVEQRRVESQCDTGRVVGVQQVKYKKCQCGPERCYDRTVTESCHKCPDGGSHGGPSDYSVGLRDGYIRQEMKNRKSSEKRRHKIEADPVPCKQHHTRQHDQKPQVRQKRELYLRTPGIDNGRI